VALIGGGYVRKGCICEGLSECCRFKRVCSRDREEWRDNDGVEVAAAVIVCFYRPLVYGSHVLRIARHQ